MRVVVVTPPDPFIDLDQAKSHLRVDGTDDDALIEAYIAAACGHIDGPHTWFGRAVGEQTLRATFSEFESDLLELPAPPLLTITSIKYDDIDGVEQTVSSSLYTLDPDGALLAYGGTWPTARDRAGSIRVVYTAGYEAIPAPIQAAALLMIGDLYQNRETTVPGAVNAVPMSATVENLLSPFRIWTV